MPTDAGHLLPLAALVLLSAVLYSSVGHGGASAYLAAMTLFGVAPGVMKPAALAMNIVVALAGTARFASHGLVPWRLLAPICLGSIPAAYLGGSLRVPLTAHRTLLGVVLLFAAVRLWLPLRLDGTRVRPAGAWLALIGAGLGLVSGITGVGGGIFLSPLLILTGWEETRRAAGASAAFILANSVAGLLGHLQGGAGGIPHGTALLAAVALGGGLYGSWLGAKRLVPLRLRRLLGGVLVVAGVKLLLA
jgi:hypothetical protein